MEPFAPEPKQAPLKVRVIRSPRRRKTSAARVKDGVIEVRVPEGIATQKEAEIVSDLVRRVERRRAAQNCPVDLRARAKQLSKSYDLPEPEDIKWVSNQDHQWASCSIDSRRIRISNRLASTPEWVIDGVILHELTHLVEPGHNANFHSLMSRYPRLERLKGFLEAMGSGHAHPNFTGDANANPRQA